MKKPDSLRAFLSQALPELARDPNALSIHVQNGRFVTRATPNLGWEYRYTLRLFLMDFRSEPEQLFLPVILWLRTNQPDLLLNHQRAAEDLKFDVDVVDAGAVDVEITLPLTEAVDVLPQPDGSYQMTIRDEMPIDDDALTDPVALLRQIYAPSGPDREFLVGYPDP